MRPNHSEPIHIADAAGSDDVLAEFFGAVRPAAREAEAAVAEAKPALARLVSAIARQDSGQALRARSLLVSLYTGGSVLADVSALMMLDWPLRRDLCTVLLAFGHGEFGYDYMKSAFEQAGDLDARWFLAAAPEARERLLDALRFAKAGSMCEPRSSGERRVADLLVSLFTGASVNLQQTLQGLDADRANMVAAIVCDFLSSRFDFTDNEMVRAHFGLRD